MRERTDRRDGGDGRQSTYDRDNTAKMREALAAIINTISEWNASGELAYWQYSALFDLADKALASDDGN